MKFFQYDFLTPASSLQKGVGRMIKTLLVAITSISLLATGPAMAIGYGTASVYSGVSWSLSSSVSGLQGCNQLYMDASGDFAQATGFVLYGAVNCPSFGGGYAAVGPGYFGTQGAFNMTINFGSGSQIICGNLNGSTLSGVCGVYNSTGFQLGTVRLTLQ
jgi:hypothetical protein